MVCNKCSDLRKSISNTTIISGAGAYPSTKELAYMVNLEYYIKMGLGCIHNIPEDQKASIKIKDMVRFLDDNKWEMGTRTSYKGFHCSSFLNRPSKQLVIVHRGTQNWEHIKTDIGLAIGVVTQDVIEKANWHTTQSLLNNALKEKDNKFVPNDYSVTITGHSLGGWLAQICTLIAKYPQFHPYGPRGNVSFQNGKSIDMSQRYDLHCVAFDSPGASKVLNRMELLSNDANLLFGKKRDVENALSSLDITVYLSNPNPVNKCGSHVGKKERIDVMSDLTYWDWEYWFNPFASHSMEKILKNFIQKK